MKTIVLENKAEGIKVTVEVAERVVKDFVPAKPAEREIPVEDIFTNTEAFDAYFARIQKESDERIRKAMGANPNALGWAKSNRTIPTDEEMDMMYQDYLSEQEEDEWDELEYRYGYRPRHLEPRYGYED